MAEATTAIADDPNNANAHSVAGFWKLFMGRSKDGFAGVEAALRLSPARYRSCRVGSSGYATSTPISPSGKRQSNGAASRSQIMVEIRLTSSILRQPAPGQATTRKQRPPPPNCRKSIPASPCRGGPAFTGPTTRPSTRNISGDRRRAAQSGVPEGRRRRIELAALSAMSGCPAGVEPRRAAPCSHLGIEGAEAGAGCDARRLSAGRSIRA